MAVVLVFCVKIQLKLSVVPPARWFGVYGNRIFTDNFVSKQHLLQSISVGRA